MYLSNYMPEENFKKIFQIIEEYGEETRMPDRFQKNENGELIPLLIPVKQSEIQFRDSSGIQIKKKTCGCMANRVKETPSS